jgi:hypothetical protein
MTLIRGATADMPFFWEEALKKVCGCDFVPAKGSHSNIRSIRGNSGPRVTELPSHDVSLLVLRGQVLPSLVTQLFFLVTCLHHPLSLLSFCLRMVGR